MLHVDINPKENYTASIKKELKNNGIKFVIGVSGGADDVPNDINDQSFLKQYREFKNTYIQHILSSFTGALRGYPIAILTGGTVGGVPEVAVKAAKEHALYTIGVFPSKGTKYAIKDELDMSVCVAPVFGEPQWGDEGGVWTSMVDATLIIGGGAGTLTECAHLLKLNESRLKNGLSPKFMIPIAGSGGVADQLHHLWCKPVVRQKCLPSTPINDGFNAARYVRLKLNLSDNFQYNEKAST